MKSLAFISFLLLFASTISTQAQWTKMGQSLGYSSGYGSIDIKLHPITGQAHVAYLDSGYCSVAKFDGANWVVIGNRIDTCGGNNFEIEFHPITNNIYVKYSVNLPQMGNQSKIEISKFDGFQWTQVGTRLINASQLEEFYSSMLFHPTTNELFVAYQDAGLRVSKLVNNNWVTLPTFQNLAGNAFNIAFHPITNNPIVVCRSTNSSIVVQEFNGSNWIKFSDTILNHPLPYAALEMIINSSTNEIYVQFFGGLSENLQTYVWNQSNWVELDTNYSFDIFGSTPRSQISNSNNLLYSLAHNNSSPQQFFFNKFDGNQWTIIGGTIGKPLSYMDVLQGGMDIIPNDTIPIVLVQNKDSSNLEAYVLGTYSNSNKVIITQDSLISEQTEGQFQWLDCANSYAEIPGETNRVFYPSHGGNYAVRTENFIFHDTSDCIFVVGVEDQYLSENLFSIYPNPANDKLQVEFKNTQKEVAVFNIIDINGKTQLNRIIDQSNSTINLSTLRSGLYFYEVKSKSGIQRGKFVKE